MNLLYFAPVPWDSYAQRSHYVVQHFLECGGRVVWVDPYPTRLPTLADFRRKPALSAVGPVRPAGLEVVSCRALPFEPWAAGGWLNRTVLWHALVQRVRPLLEGEPVAIGIGRPSALALAALTGFNVSWSFYDAMDDFPEFYTGLSKRSVQRYEEQIVRTVDVVATASSTLWRKFEWAGLRRRMVPNAFEMALLPPPVVRHGQRVFGYVGCIGAWFDWPMVVRLATTVPDAAVHVVGPCYARPPRSLPPNVTLFPACSASGAIEHFERFSVGLIPFRRTPLTEAVDPVKYYGYRAMGLPVLSTSFGEMSRRGLSEGTYLLNGDATFAQTARAALDAAPPAATSVLAFRQEHSWRRRLDDARLFDLAPVS